jgi:hypothetical protein
MSKTTCTIEIGGVTVSYIHETLSNSLPGPFTIPQNIVRGIGAAVFGTDAVSFGTSARRETELLSEGVFRSVHDFYMTAGVVRGEGHSFCTEHGAKTLTGTFTMVADYNF